MSQATQSYLSGQTTIQMFGHFTSSTARQLFEKLRSIMGENFQQTTQIKPHIPSIQGGRDTRLNNGEVSTNHYSRSYICGYAEENPQRVEAP